jgi:hypothetical protein
VSQGKGWKETNGVMVNVLRVQLKGIKYTEPRFKKIVLEIKLRKTKNEEEGKETR